MSEPRSHLSAEVVICGAGIAGVSAAYFLASRKGIQNVILVDPRPPLSLTSDHSTECYRNWWPGPDAAMVSLMNRSIDLLEELADESHNRFHLNRRGYLYCSDNAEKIPSIIQQAEEISAFGAGNVRLHSTSTAKGYQPAPPEGFRDQPNGADILLNTSLIRTHFPYLSPQVKLALHVRRAGWLSAQQLGMYLLSQARAKGATLKQAHVTGLDTKGGALYGVYLNAKEFIRTPNFILASGPFLKQTAWDLCTIDLPVQTELHLKIALRDPNEYLDRLAPLVIWNEPQKIPWEQEEIEWFHAEGMEDLLEELPPGLHTRPEGGTQSETILLLWEYNARVMPPIFPIPLDPLYAEVALRGLTRMIPAFKGYLGKMPRPRIDGGYYTKTPENRPLIGSLPIPGTFVFGGLSGFGIMAACASAELIANIICGDKLPDYAPAFSPSRYQDAAYIEKMKTWNDQGEL